MTTRDINLIRFVTARQADLRGLREVVGGAFICVAIPLLLWRLETGGLVGWLIHLALYLVVRESVLRFVDRRYDSTYGRVTPTDGQPAPRPWPMTAQTLLFGIVLDMTPWFPLWGVSGFPIVIAIYGLWIAFRDFPWRVYHLGAVAVVLAAPAVDDPSRMLSHLPAYFAGGFTLILTGLFDHLLLARAMTRLRRLGPTRERCEPESLGSTAERSEQP